MFCIINQNKNNFTSKTSAAVTKVTGLGFGLLWISKPKSGRGIDNFDPECTVCILGQ